MITFQNLRKIHGLEHGITEIGDAAPELLVQGEQVHKIGCTWVTNESPTLPEMIPRVDTLATADTGVAISVRVADCVPLLLFHPQKKVIAAVHAGWRGTALQITRKSIEWLSKEHRVSPFQWVVGVGPAIGPQDFIVDEDVSRQFAMKYVRASQTEEGKFHVDLWQANVDQLVDAGVALKNIEVVKRSTFSDPKLYSARRGDRQERNIAWIRKVS